MLPATVRGANRGYLAALIGLAEPTIIGKSLADHGDRCTSVQKRPHFERLRILEANGTPCLYNIAGIHYDDVDAWAWISLVEGIPI